MTFAGALVRPRTSTDPGFLAFVADDSLARPFGHWSGAHGTSFFQKQLRTPPTAATVRRSGPGAPVNVALFVGFSQ